MWHCVQIGVKTLSWMDWKSAVTPVVVPGEPPLVPEPIGCPFASRPSPLPAQPPRMAQAARTVQVAAVSLAAAHLYREHNIPGGLHTERLFRE